MKIFHCDHCRNLVFFENTTCLKCGRRLAYLPDLRVIGSLDPAGPPDVWASPLPRAAGRTYRLCRNFVEHDVCNWAVPAASADELCGSCRLTRVIPDLTRAAHKQGWYRLEVAKRRLVYTLAGLNLPLVPKTADPDGGLAFEFLADPDPGTPGAAPVLTGHANGVITVNVAEADDAEREKRRVSLGEPYRTLLGHFRHEVGHYYWDRLIRDSGRLEAFRGRFGDERADYARALERHYQAGPPPDWPGRFVSAYASSHPWEDWAETWAHYLHMVDALETAAACGVSLRPRRPGEPALRTAPDPLDNVPEPFDDLIAGWFPLTYMLNNLNRGLGLPDGYPFVLSAPAVDKLRFVHDTIAGPVASTG